MKKLLKSGICGSVNSARICTVHCGKVNKCGLNQKKKRREIHMTKTQTQQLVESKHSHSVRLN